MNGLVPLNEFQTSRKFKNLSEFCTFTRKKLLLTTQSYLEDKHVVTNTYVHTLW